MISKALGLLAAWVLLGQAAAAGAGPPAPIEVFRMETPDGANLEFFSEVD